MSTSGTPDFEAIAREDALRFDRLKLAPDDELRIAGAYNHWVKLLLVEARKQLDKSGHHPRPITAPVPGGDVRRNIILHWDEAPPELFAQIWIVMSDAQPKVTYRFVGRGYPTGDQESL